MTANCRNCGAELIEGQRFCRMCGMEASASASAEQPTRIFAAQEQFPTQEQAGFPNRTSRLPESRTDQVYRPPMTAPQPFAPAQTAGLATPQRGRSSHLWLYVLLGISMFGLVTLAILFFAAQNARQPRMVVVRKDSPQVPPQPQAPGGALPLDEGDAEVSGDKTVIDKFFPLRSGATISLRNVSGDIKVEGWDEPRAEVRVVKSGGSADEREAVRINMIAEENKLSFETPMLGSNHVDVRYELMLPRNVGALSVSSMSSDVKLSELSGSITIDLQKGSIELQEVGGSIKAKTIKGDIKAELDGAAQKGSQEFSTVKGDVELQLGGNVNTDLKAETMDGEIDLDDDFNLHVEKAPAGQHVAGRIGAGGGSLFVKTVKGNIKLKK